MNEMLQAQYSIKTTIIGEAAHLKKELRVLNRIVRWHPGQGVTYEADPRHAEILARDLKGNLGKVITTPYCKPAAEETEEEKQLDIDGRKRAGSLLKKLKSTVDTSGSHTLEAEQATQYRALIWFLPLRS